MFEVHLPADVDASEIAVRLAGQEFLGVWEQEGRVVVYWRGSEAAIRAGLCAVFQEWECPWLQEQIVVQPVVEQDWNAKWAASVKPLYVGKRMVIRPSWTEPTLPKNGIDLILDPKQAFGTGHHATTRMVLEWLEESTWVSGARILDIGTGSGILGMAALRLGAARVLGIDVDAIAISCAKEYAQVNGFQEELELRCCGVEGVTPSIYEVLLANIDRNTLLEILPACSDFRGGNTQLILSGLLQEEEEEMIRFVESQGWNWQESRTDEGWLALHFKVDPSSGCD